MEVEKKNKLLNKTCRLLGIEETKDYSSSIEEVANMFRALVEKNSEEPQDIKVKLFKEIVEEMADLYSKKNSNYGDSFGDLYNDLGPISGIVPLHNKLNRITNLIKGDNNNFESLEDSFKDLACYAIMNLIELKLAKEEEKEKVNNECSKCLYSECGIGKNSPCTICSNRKNKEVKNGI